MDVSVICPVFNTHPSLITAAARSVLDQAGPHRRELILADDASTSLETQAALREVAASDERVRLVVQSTNAGPGHARTAGVQHASHDWVGFIDADDLWPDGKLDHAQAMLQERPDTRWIGGAFTTLLPGGVMQRSRLLTQLGLPQEAGRLARRLPAPGITRTLIGDWMPLGASLMKRDLFEAAGGFDARLVYGEDWLLNLRLSTIAPMDYSETSTYTVRRQGLSMMRSPARMTTKLVHSVQIACRDPALQSVRRELRWFYYSTCKDLAMNNALNGRKLTATLFALRALATDPREVQDILTFIRLLPAKGPALMAGLQRYSTAEQVILDQLGPQHGGALPELVQKGKNGCGRLQH